MTDGRSARLTAAQAAVRYLAAQHVASAEEGGSRPYFGGCWAIFGHGNATGLGEALHAERAILPTFRAHNEQAMAHAAVAFAKQSRRRRAMICTTSIGPGATNLVTAAAAAHVNRLPVLLLPGDVFAGRRPDPVLQQIEAFGDATVSANDCLRPVSRLFDRITRPEQLLDALPRAMATLTDPARCGPVTLAFCQDVQAEAIDWPLAFFERRIRSLRAPRPDPRELADLARLLRYARAPLIVAGGGVLYAGAEAVLASFAETRGVPVAETQAGKGSLAWDHPMNLGAIGVTGAAAANRAAAEADLVIGIGTRLTDFTTGSRALIGGGRSLVQINVAAFDAEKQGALPVVGDAREGLALLDVDLAGWRAPALWVARSRERIARGNAAAEAAFRPDATPPDEGDAPPTEADVLAALWRQLPPSAVVVAAAGGLPGILHRTWRVREPGTYHVEYGFSCMGYEIAGGLGVKLAAPDREVHVLVGDGSYLMMNSEIATAVALDRKLIVTVFDNRGHACISRLQQAHGSASFGTMLDDAPAAPPIDFAAHARSLGAHAEQAAGIAGFEAALARARAADRTAVIVIGVDPAAPDDADGVWWDVPVAAASDRPAVAAARVRYEAARGAQREGAAPSVSA